MTFWEITGFFIYFVHDGMYLVKMQAAVPDQMHKIKKREIGRAADFDIQMLKDNLKRSYAERIRRHQIALETMEMLQKAKLL